MGRKIAKAHRAKQTPHGKQTVKKLMAHGASTNSLELSGDTKLFDRVARKWNVDYAFYQTEPGKYLLFFKSGQRVVIYYNCIGAFDVPNRRKIPEADIIMEARKGVALSYAPEQVAV